MRRAPEASEDRLGEARRFLGRRDTFALVAPFLAGAEDAVAEAARAEKVPVVGPFTSSPKSGSPPNRYVFYLHSSLADQARALALFADGRLAGRKPSAILLFADDDEEARSASQAVRAECLRLGWGRVEGPSRVPPDQPDRMKFDVAFVLSPGCREVEGLLAAGPTGRGPLVLIPGALAGKEVLDWASDVRDRLFLSFPTLPLDITPDGSAEYGRLAAAYKLPEGYRSSQIEALAAAKVLVEALTAAGRGVGRETLIDQLEHFYQRPTGLTRPITFGPNRRFGTRGAYIAGVAASRAKLVPVGGYIEPPLTLSSGGPAMSLNVVCIKWGTKYPPEYVNHLARAVRRHLTLPHRFVCLTDDPRGIDADVETKPLAEELPGWWNKLALFQPRVHDLEGTLLFIDLDMVVVGNLDGLALHPGRFLAVPTRRGDGEFSSALLRFEVGRHRQILGPLRAARRTGHGGDLRRPELDKRMLH